MGRAATEPIPRHLWDDVFRCLWSVAQLGQWDGDRGQRCGVRSSTPERVHLRRRHALTCLWGLAIVGRFSEVAGLRFVDLDGQACRIYVRRAKGGVDGHHQVSSLLVDVTLDWRDTLAEAAMSEWLIPSAVGSQIDNQGFNDHGLDWLRRSFPELRVTSHSFRDTGIQLAKEQSGDTATTQRAAGHRTRGMTEAYLAKMESRQFELKLFAPKYSPMRRPRRRA